MESRVVFLVIEKTKDGRELLRYTTPYPHIAERRIDEYAHEISQSGSTLFIEINRMVS